MTILFMILLLIMLAVSGCGPKETVTINENSPGRESTHLVPDGGSTSAEISEFTLQTGIVDGRMAFVGRGGDIDGIVNPDLVVPAGTAVRLTVINEDGISHDLSIPDLGVKTPLLSSRGSLAELSLTLDESEERSYAYFCEVSGHRQAGMEGKLLVRPDVESVSFLGK